MSSSSSLHPHQHLLIPDIFILANLLCPGWYLIVGLVWIRLMTNNVEYFCGIIGRLCMFLEENSIQILCP